MSHVAKGGALQRSRIFHGWWLLGAGSLANAVGSIHIYAFTVFFIPLSESLALSRAATALAFSLARAEGGVEGPLSGWLVDRKGPRVMLVGGALLAGLGYIAFSQVDSYIPFLLVYLLLISIPHNAGFSNATMAMANMWFIRRRALAFSIQHAAWPAGAVILVPVLTLVVESLGWRWAAFISGLLFITIAAPCGLVLRRSPESMGLRPDGDPPEPEAPREEREAPAGPRRTVQPEGFTVRQAFRTFTYWQLSLATALRLMVQGAIFVHIIPILVWKGMDAPVAAGMLALRLFVTIPLRLGTGWFADQVSKSLVVTLGMAAGIAGYSTLVLGQAMWHLYAAMILLAVMEGTNAINWAIVGDFFGRRSFATLRGTMGLFYSWGMFVTPVFAGWVYDRTESYELALWTFIGVLVLAALCFVTLRRPKAPQPGGRLVQVGPGAAKIG